MTVAKLIQQMFWPRHENRVNKKIPVLPHNSYVSFKSGSIAYGLG